MTPLWRRPIWLLGHVVALTACALFVRAGIWQLDRLDQKKARNEVIAERMDGDAVDVLDVDPDEAEYQRVTATGTFDTPIELAQQPYQGSVGINVLAPLVLADGSAVLVNRGWTPNDAVLEVPAGEVTVEGVLRDSGRRRTDVNVGRVQDDYDRELFPLWLSQTAPEPDGDYPILLDEPARDEGPHLSYAIQWFLFTGVVAVGYPILLRRRLRAEHEPSAWVRVPEG